jgi:hypothetical protein
MLVQVCQVSPPELGFENVWRAPHPLLEGEVAREAGGVG